MPEFFILFIILYTFRINYAISIIKLIFKLNYCLICSVFLQNIEAAAHVFQCIHRFWDAQTPELPHADTVPVSQTGISYALRKLHLPAEDDAHKPYARGSDGCVLSQDGIPHKCTGRNASVLCNVFSSQWLINSKLVFRNVVI